MRSTLKRILVLPALLGTLFLWGCDEASEAPKGLLSSQPGEAPFYSASGTGYWPVSETSFSSATAMTVVRPNSSARVRLGNHELYIPAGAVSQTTTFTMQRVSGSELKFSLRATATDKSGRKIDVGARGFEKPIELTVDYGKSADLKDPSRAVVGWLNGGNRVVIQPTVVDAGAKKVRAELKHFSDYILLMP